MSNNGYRFSVSFLSLLSLFCVLSGNVFADDQTSPEGDKILNSLIEYNSNIPSADASKLEAIRENGLKAGAQGGMLKRSKELLAEITLKSQDLDKTFNFQPFIDKAGFLPPVIVESKQNVKTKDNAQRIEYAGVTYRVIYPAKFVRIAPTWRDYLFVGIGDKRLSIDPLPDAIKPKTDDEKKVWKEAVIEGWKIGEQQADQIFQENVKKLQRDYVGMAKYMYLLKEGMINKPILAQTPDSVKITDDQIQIGVGAKEIEVPAKMEKNESNWGRSAK